MLIKKHIQGRLKVMTECKFFGAYYHSLLCHAPDQLRIFLGRVINTEKEGATFNLLKTTANLTSNKKPDHVLYNSVVRFQMQNEDESLNRKLGGLFKGLADISIFLQKISVFCPKKYVYSKQYCESCVRDFLVLFSDFVRQKVTITENMTFGDSLSGIQPPDFS